MSYYVHIEGLLGEAAQLLDREKERAEQELNAAATAGDMEEGIQLARQLEQLVRIVDDLADVRWGIIVARAEVA